MKMKWLIPICFVVIFGLFAMKFMNQEDKYDAVEDQVEINGILLGMTIEDVEKVLGKQLEKLDMMGGDGYFDSETESTYYFDLDGSYKNMLTGIRTEFEEYDLFGINVGDNLSVANEILIKNGFSKIEGAIGAYQKRNLFIRLDANSSNNTKIINIDLWIEDKSSEDITY